MNGNDIDDRINRQSETAEEQPVVKEFIRPQREPAPIRRKRRKRKRRRGLWYHYGKWVILGTFLASFLILLFSGILLWNYPALSLGLVMLLETILSICLYGKWIWVQLAAVLFGIVFGIFFHLTGIMIIGTCIYIIAAIGLYFLLDD